MASPVPPDTELRLILVEDNAIFRRAVEAHLIRHRRWTIVASIDNGDDALPTIRRTSSDVVLLDISLPGMNGFQIAEAVRALPNPPAIVFLTLHDSNPYREQARELGAAGFVTKDQFVARLMPLLDVIAAQRGSHAKGAPTPDSSTPQKQIT